MTDLDAMRAETRVRFAVSPLYEAARAVLAAVDMGQGDLPPRHLRALRRSLKTAEEALR